MINQQKTVRGMFQIKPSPPSGYQTHYAASGDTYPLMVREQQIANRSILPHSPRLQSFANHDGIYLHNSLCQRTRVNSRDGEY